MIDPCNFLQKIQMCEIIFIDDPCLTHHAQIFDRQRNQFPLPQFIHTGTLRKDRNANTSTTLNIYSHALEEFDQKASDVLSDTLMKKA